MPSHIPARVISSLLFLVLACALTDARRFVATETRTPLPSAAASPVPSATTTATPTPLPPTRTLVPVPPWVEDFARPILDGLVGRQPDFQDDFSAYYGWVQPAPDGGAGVRRAELADGALVLSLPPGSEPTELLAYNRRLARADYVLSLDFKFGKTGPEDVFRLQFGLGAPGALRLDLSKTRHWTIAWRLHFELDSRAGAYEFFAPEWNNLLILLRGEQCAVFLNRDPLDYIARCRSGVVGPAARNVGFQLLSDSGHGAQVSVDNVIQWDLAGSPLDPP
jgi:hypothetical protein